MIEDARIARGQTAWSHIKATAEQQREAWRDIGVALLVGRKGNPSNKDFSDWVKAYGFDDMCREDRTGALWLARNWESVRTRCPDSLSHPRRIRAFMLKEAEKDEDWVDVKREGSSSDLTEELESIKGEKVEAFAKQHSATVEEIKSQLEITQK